MTSPNVTQAMIDAYYEYTHLTLDRGKFVKKLRAMTEPDAAARVSYPFEFTPEDREPAQPKLRQ